MTDDLYRRNGGAPARLPATAYDAQNNAYTAPYAAADLKTLGYVKAPPRPDDTDAQTAEWDDSAEAWVMVDRPPPPPPPEPSPYVDFVPVSLLRQRVEKLGMLDAFAAYLGQRPTLMMKVLTLESGVDPAYPDLATAFDEMDIPDAFRAYILAPPSAGVGEAPTMG